MATFSTNLKLTLPADGEYAGTWGQITNTNLGTLLEQAVSGYTTQAVATGTDTTITIPDGATGVARNMYLELTGTGGTNTNLIVPANRKLYFISNATSGTPGQVTVKVLGQPGVSVPAGKKMLLVCNGTDVVEAVNYFSASFTAGAINSTPIGATTASTGAFTTLSVSSTATFTSTVTAARFSATSSTAPTIGIYAAGTTGLGFASNGIARGSVDVNGAWSINAPSTGQITFTINGVTGTHSTKIADSAAATFNAGYLETPVNATTGVTISPGLSDSGKTFYFTGSTAPTATIPANGTVAYPVGTVLTFVNDASAAVNMSITITGPDVIQLAGTGSTTLPKTLARYGVATAIKVATQKWIISGTGLT